MQHRLLDPLKHKSPELWLSEYQPRTVIHSWEMAVSAPLGGAAARSVIIMADRRVDHVLNVLW